MATWLLKNLDSTAPATEINNVEYLEEALTIFGFRSNFEYSKMRSQSETERWHLIRLADKTEYMLTRAE